jgi:uncharacterized protein (TIGR03118 family)
MRIDKRIWTRRSCGLGAALVMALIGACGGSGGSGASGGGYGMPPSTPPPTSPPPTGSAFSMSKLVSDGSVAAASTDTHLVNPWGIVMAPGAPVWVANNGSQTSSVYDGRGAKLTTLVSIPAGLNGAADPTGIVFNGGTDFVVSKGSASAPAKFIFDGEGGTVSAWAPSVDPQNAIVMYDDGAGGAVYKGLAVAADTAGVTRLYATDFHNGKVDVFDDTFKKVTLAGGFVDPTLPAGYAPFGIQALAVQGQTLIYVTYAKQQPPDNHDNADGAGLGLVDVYDTSGALKSHLIAAGGKLDGPWGMALAPANFGSFGGKLLVGNFGDGIINAFDPVTGAFAGSIEDSMGQAIATPGLWGIAFGNGAQNQPATTLYFAAGIANEADGLYGRIDAGATPPDIVAPTATITSPAANATVTGTVAVTATASDDVGVTEVKFFAGTTAIGTSATAPYSVNWNTTTVANGSVTLTAQAQDAAGNVGTSAGVKVTVSNAAPAQVTLTQLQTSIFTPICSVCHTGAGSSLPGSMNLTAGHAFASLVGVASVEQPSVLRVKPGDPANSYIIRKLEGAAGITGQRMPLGGPYLDQATIDQVQAWISAGAQNN